MKADEIGLQLNIKMDADNELERYKKEYFDF